MLSVHLRQVPLNCTICQSDVELFKKILLKFKDKAKRPKHNKNFVLKLNKLENCQFCLMCAHLFSRGFLNTAPGNTKGGNITVPLTSCLTGLE
jgi:hypothetical protein